MKRFRIGAGAASALVLLVVAFAGWRTSHAADSGDGPIALAEPTADITDLYAFMRPGDAGTHAAFVMNLRPGATAESKFDTSLDYIFRVQRVLTVNPLKLDPVDLRIRCNVLDSQPQQTAVCNAPGVGIRAFMVGTPDAGGESEDLRVFAGARANPFFFDRTAYNATLDAGALSFSPTQGTNAFAGTNVLSIVVELNVAKAFNLDDAGSRAPMLAISGEVLRP